MNLLPYDLVIPRNYYAFSQVNSVMLSLHQSLQFKYQFEPFTIGLEGINRGLGVGLMPGTPGSNPYYTDLMTKKIIELDDRSLRSDITLIYRKSFPLSKIARLFIDEAKLFIEKS